MNNGIESFVQLMRVENPVRDWRNFGRGALRELVNVLAEYGIVAPAYWK